MGRDAPRPVDRCVLVEDRGALVTQTRYVCFLKQLADVLDWFHSNFQISLATLHVGPSKGRWIWHPKFLYTSHQLKSRHLIIYLLRFIPTRFQHPGESSLLRIMMVFLYLQVVPKPTLLLLTSTKESVYLTPQRDLSAHGAALRSKCVRYLHDNPIAPARLLFLPIESHLLGALSPLPQRVPRCAPGFLTNFCCC